MNETTIETSTEIEVFGLHQPSVSISGTAKERAEIAIKAAEEIVVVNNPEDQKRAVDARTALRSIQKGMETSRELVKRPVLEIGRLIDSTAKTFLIAVDQEVSRLNAILNKFQKEEFERAEKVRREQEEIRRKAAEEAARKQAELEAAAKAAAKKDIVTKLEVLHQMDANEQKLAETVKATVQAENQAAPSRVVGMRVRKQWKFEVTDIRALHAAKPDLVILEPNGPVIRGMISAGMRECPGLRIFEEITT